jgi:hypothetical protein
LSAGNIGGFANINGRVSSQFVAGLNKKITASSFKHVVADQVNEEQLDAIIEHMNTGAIAKIEDTNEKLFNRIIERFQEIPRADAIKERWGQNNNLKQYISNNSPSKNNNSTKKYPNVPGLMGNEYE